MPHAPRISSSIVLLAIAVVACSRAAEDKPVTSRPSSDARIEGARPTAKDSVVILRPPGKSEARVRVRVARTEEQRRRGLMYVQALPPDDGMLFMFPDDDVQSFWMKNTLIPLDMIFIDKDLVVVGVVENAEPLTTTGRAVDRESRYVLEVNGGYARAKGIGAGTKVEFEGI